MHALFVFVFLAANCIWRIGTFADICGVSVDTQLLYSWMNGRHSDRSRYIFVGDNLFSYRTKIVETGTDKGILMGADFEGWGLLWVSDDVGYQCPHINATLLEFMTWSSQCISSISKNVRERVFVYSATSLCQCQRSEYDGMSKASIQSFLREQWQLVSCQANGAFLEA